MQGSYGPCLSYTIARSNAYRMKSVCYTRITFHFCTFVYPSLNLMRQSVVLGIESSCDDTAAAVLSGNELKASIISSQLVHEKFGGVVPELASRDHQRFIVPVVEEALAESGFSREDVTGIAVTSGPGLAGSLLVGLCFAKAMAFALDIPLVGVNHLEGHIYSVFLEEPPPPFPFLCLIVSGGHTQLVKVEEGFAHTVLGSTRDDAAGEAFDKVAKMMGLGYPGGPKIDALAKQGDSAFHTFPRSSLGGYDFSFSGLKTAVLYYLNSFNEEERTHLLNTHLADVCASFQETVVDMLVRVVRRAVRQTGIRDVAVVGGVSANSGLRSALEGLSKLEDFSLYVPSLKFCTDNAAMIARAGAMRLEAGHTSSFDLTAVPSLKI